MRITKLLLLALMIFTSGAVSAKGKKGEKKEGYKFTKEVSIPTTPVKDQANSGTCWSYATTSFIETELIRLGKGEHDLAEMFFVRYAYEQKALKYTRVHGLGNFSQGGQGHDVTKVIAEFGMVPESAYPGLNYGTTYHKHKEMEGLMKAVLDKSLSSKKSFTGKSLEVVDATLDIYLGEEPQEFEYKGKTYTPKSFTEEMGLKADDYIELTSYSIYPFYQGVNLEVPDNWSHDLYYNLPIDELMQVINNAFEMGYSVNWDGDVSEQGFSHRNGVAVVPDADAKSLDDNERLKWEAMSEKEQNALLYSFSAPRKEKEIDQNMRQKAFDTFKSTDDHLMHLVGTARDQKGTKYYLTKNSWADDSNKMGGYLYMSESYLRLNTVAIQVHKDVLPAALKAKLGIK